MEKNDSIFRDLWKSLREKLKESLASVVPVSLLVFLLSVTPWVDISKHELFVFSGAAILLVIGISLFNLGADQAMTPMGQHIGEGLTKSKKLGILLTVCFVMGLLITVAEPDLSVLAGQVGAVINGTMLIATVGLGVGLFLLLGVVKIVFHGDLTAMLLFFYMLLFCLAAFLIDSGKGSFFPLSFDSGGVTTGPITVPFIMALGVGIALTVGGRNASENSFGLIALCSVGPVAAVLLLAFGCAFHSGDRHAFVRNNPKMLRGHHGKIVLSWLCSLITLLPIIIAIVAVIIRYLPVLQDLNGLVMKTVSLPSTKVSLIILAVGGVLTIPLLPLRPLIPAAFVNGLEKE